MLGCLLVARFPLACELADHPELVGWPVGVSGEDGRVLAASPAAEAYGVRPGQALREAIGLCPTLSVLEERPARYRARWAEILGALELVAFTIEPASAGEAYLDLDELVACYRSLEAAMAAALTCVPSALEPRMGAAPTRFTALLAAHQAAPGGGRVVTEKGLAAFLAGQPVDALPVSAEMLRRLRVLQLKTLGKLRALPRSALAAQFGPEGALAWELAHGRDQAPLRPQPQRLRLVERLSLETPLVSRPAILAAWEQTLSRLLRQQAFGGLAARQVELGAATERGRHWSRTVTFKEALTSLERMWAALRSVLDEAQFPGPLDELTVELRGLVQAGGQQLALPNARSALRGRLEESLRQLKARYGYCPVGRVVEMEPWSRIPERRLALIDFDP
jgi:nucleotidyltransferase/DNA polymerase involved in DNA repair